MGETQQGVRYHTPPPSPISFIGEPSHAGDTRPRPLSLLLVLSSTRKGYTPSPSSCSLSATTHHHHLHRRHTHLRHTPTPSCGTGALAIFLRKSFQLDITTSDYDDQEIKENIAYNCRVNEVIPALPHIKHGSADGRKYLVKILLVLGAARGVGLAVMQIWNLRGATVISIARILQVDLKFPSKPILSSAAKDLISQVPLLLFCRVTRQKINLAKRATRKLRLHA